MQEPAARAGEEQNSAERAVHRVAALEGKRRAGAAFLGGSISVLAFAPFHLFAILFFTLPLLFWLIETAAAPRRAFLDGWWFGFGFFLFNLFWIGEAFLVEAERFAWAMPFAVTLLPAGMALFWATAAWLTKVLWRPDGSGLMLFALLFGLAEWVRGHVLTGLPWNVLGYALTYPLELMQGAAAVGVYTLSFAALLIYTAPCVLLVAPKFSPRRRAGLSLAIAVLPLSVLWALGAWRLAADPRPDVPGVKLRLVQPSVPQREKWLPLKQRNIFEDHLALSATAPTGEPDGLAGITHVIWPEAAMPFLPLEHQEALDAIGAILPQGTTLITGAIRREIGPEQRQRGYNSLLVFNSDGGLVSTYDKVHLVPFGEYLPLQGLLSALGLSKLTHGLGSFATGPMPRPLIDVPGLPPTGGLICYEVLFPGEVVDDANRPNVLVNVTNDGWFGDTTGPRQHYFQTRVRAVEEGVPIIRVANNGISAVIDAYGRERVRIAFNAHRSADSALPSALEPPPYARLRDRIFIAAALALGLLSLLWHRS